MLIRSIVLLAAISVAAMLSAWGVTYGHHLVRLPLGDLGWSLLALGVVTTVFGLAIRWKHGSQVLVGGLFLCLVGLRTLTHGSDSLLWAIGAGAMVYFSALVVEEATGCVTGDLVTFAGLSPPAMAMWYFLPRALAENQFSETLIWLFGVVMAAGISIGALQLLEAMRRPRRLAR